MKKIFVFCLLLFICFCCKKTSRNKEDFNDFVVRFYSDSLFQVNRIVFPLPLQYGSAKVIQINSQNTIKIDTLYWDRKSWKFLKNNPKKLSSRQWKYNIKDSLDIKVETLALQNTGQSYIIKFKPIENKWFLIHYEEHNW